VVDISDDFLSALRLNEEFTKILAKGAADRPASRLHRACIALTAGLDDSRDEERV
jgi:hypothetical protein